MAIPQELVGVGAFFSFWLGACIASFLNVVVWRVPRGESIVSPPSHCPRCGAAIRWYQNVPILSWLALRGRCASCRAPISPRYVLVEALGALLFAGAFLHLASVGAPLYHLALWWVWLSLMVVGTFIDFDHQLLPDFVTVGGMVLGVAFAGADAWAARSWMPFARSLAGLAFGLGLLGLVRWLGSKAFRREAMGMGDVLLLGAVGALFGPVAVVFTMVVSSVVGSLAGLGVLLAARARLGGMVAIPYGPYLCIGCLVWMFRGPALVSWYANLLKP